MKNKFNSRGVYVVSIKGLKNGEKLYLDKKYEYDIYYYSSKKDYSNANGELEEQYLESSCKDLLPNPAKNINFFDFDDGKYIDNSNIFKCSPPPEKIKFNQKNFYCIIIDEINIDDLVFSDSVYNQKIYEFETKEELDEFINGNKKDKKPKKILKGTLQTKKQENVVYLLVNGNEQKVLKKEYILDSKKFKSNDNYNDYTVIVFWPSMDTYVFNCHEDYVYHEIIFEGDLIKEEVEAKDFISDVEDYYKQETDSVKDFTCQYVGKTFDFDFDDPYKILVSNYLRFDFIRNNEMLDYLKYLRTMEKVLDLNERIKTNPEESTSEARDLLISMRIIDEMGNVLSPFNKLISKDDSLENNSEDISKTKKTRNKKKKA